MHHSIYCKMTLHIYGVESVFFPQLQVAMPKNLESCSACFTLRKGTGGEAQKVRRKPQKFPQGQGSGWEAGGMNIQKVAVL